MLTKEILLKLYKSGYLIRAVDEVIEDGLKSNDFFALHYPVKGQELISSSLGLSKKQGDKIISTYRCMGDFISFGGSFYRYLSEIMGSKEGISGGKGGCMHICSPEIGLLATTGIVGGGLAIACGAALALPDNSDNIIFVTFGDGATTTGAYHESMNLAGLWQLPVLFVCINNGYALHTKLSKITANTSLHTKTISYGIRGFYAEVSKPDMLYTIISKCTEYVRLSRCPIFLEISSPRLHGHMAGSTTEYMNLPPQSKISLIDPLILLRHKLLNLYISENEFFDMESLIRQEVFSVYNMALKAPYPDEQDLLIDVTGSIK